MSAQLSILVIDDDEPFRERLIRSLRERGCAVEGAASSSEVQKFEAPHLDFIVLDLRLGEESGLSLLEGLQERWPTARVICLTGYGSIASAVEAMRLGAFGYLTKPITSDDLLAAFQGEDRANGPLQALPHQPLSLARTEWEHIQRVLNDCDGNITHAAKLLKIPRRSLQRKLAKYPPPQ